ncbi:hypothetical protein CHARACLAT_030191 [Characodon lateralis]|uniref:Uncharacterized protein n=1 Tax=Characodon lateralis TaxID=208331 RepID=A0ABU7DVF1_9TELE|nr:hypothetical protein [Characodon lateralis]
MYSTTRKRNTGYQQKYLPPTIKHCGRRVMIRTCVAAIGPGHLSDDRELLCRPKDSKDKCRLKVGPNRVINRTMNPKTAANIQRLDNETETPGFRPQQFISMV